MAKFETLSELSELHGICLRRARPEYRGTRGVKAQYLAIARDCETLAKDAIGLDRVFLVRMTCIAVVAGLLVALWAAAAGAADCLVKQTECHERPLANGRQGETVLVCERVQLVCEAAR